MERYSVSNRLRRLSLQEQHPPWGQARPLVERNVHPKALSEALGHASVGITGSLYSHVQDSMSRTAADTIEEVFGGSASEGAGT
jgi:hypothetical protein